MPHFFVACREVAGRNLLLPPGVIGHLTVFLHTKDVLAISEASTSLSTAIKTNDYVWREICLARFGWMENEENGNKVKGEKIDLVGDILKEAASGESSRFYHFLRTFRKTQKVLKG